MPGWAKWTSAIAACLVLTIGVSLFFGGMGGNAGAGGSGHEEGSTFMSYAGPVFPLTLREENAAISAERTVTMDFEPWVPVWISNEEEAASRTNLTEEEKQDVLDTHFGSSLQDQLQDPTPMPTAPFCRENSQIEDFHLITDMIEGDVGDKFLLPQQAKGHEGLLGKSCPALRRRPRQGKTARLQSVHAVGICRPQPPEAWRMIIVGSRHGHDPLSRRTPQRKPA